MGALGNLSRKIKRRDSGYKRGELTIMPHAAFIRRPTVGFYAGLTPEQKAQALAVGDGIVVFPLELSRGELERRETIGEIQPSHPGRYESHGHEYKGRVFNGECNRGACNSRRAIYYNRGTYSYYCVPCGRSINQAGSRDFKVPLCLEVTENLTHERMNELYKEQWV
ncbi:hypothetical protein EV128_12596 [Rhizobium azibense]|nr:hypothetical protein EV128_12596 [Rhizobium azibense]